MTKGSRIFWSAIGAIAAVAVVVVSRREAGLEPVVSHGFTGPGFIGFVVGLLIWLWTGRKKVG